MMKVLDFALFVMVHVWIGKEFPDMSKDERIEFIRVGSALFRTVAPGETSKEHGSSACFYS